MGGEVPAEMIPARDCFLDLFVISQSNSSPFFHKGDRLGVINKISVLERGGQVAYPPLMIMTTTMQTIYSVLGTHRVSFQAL